MLKDIYKNNKGWITVTYIILIIEFFIIAILPYTLGKSLDAMLAGDYNIFWIYLGLTFGSLIVGVTRRRVDARIFSRIWGKSVVKTVNDMIIRDVHPTKIVSRCQLARSFADFFEFHIPQIIYAVIEMSVAAVMITWIVPTAGIIVIGLLLFSMAVMWYIAHRIALIETRLQHSRERADQAVLDRNPNIVQAEYDGRVKDYIKRSDIDAVGWGLIDVLSVVSGIIVIFALVKGHNTLGEIMAALDYTWKIFNRMGPMTNFFQQWKQTQVADKFINKED